MNENADIEAVSMWVSAGSDSDVCHLLLAPAPSCCISCSTLSKENQRININKFDSKIQSSPFPIHVILCVHQETGRLGEEETRFGELFKIKVPDQTLLMFNVLHDQHQPSL